jgi:hypothetical protein
MFLGLLCDGEGVVAHVLESLESDLAISVQVNLYLMCLFLTVGSSLCKKKISLLVIYSMPSISIGYLNDW